MENDINNKSIKEILGFDYKRIFNENITNTGKNEDTSNKNPEKIIFEKKEKKKEKEKKFIAAFLIQSVICLLIIGSIITIKYTTPNTFVSVSSVLNGLYENNVTLSDLNKLIDEKILGNDALAAFFNMNGE